MASDPTPPEKELLKQAICEAARDGDATHIWCTLSGLAPELVTEVLHHHSWDPSCFGTPLAIAAYRRHLAVVKLLVDVFHVNLDQRAVVSFLCMRYVTPLMCAAFNRDVEMARLLLRRGCDVNLGITGFHRAGPTRTSVVGTTALHIAAWDNSIKVAELLLEYNPVMSRDKEGRTPSYVAALAGSSGVLVAILKSSGFSRRAKIDHLELLGALKATSDLQKAFKLLRKAMIERYRDPRDICPKPISFLPIQSNMRESITVEELRAREHDEDILHLECLAIAQRHIPASSPEFVRPFYRRFVELENRKRYHEATAIWLHCMKTAHHRNSDEFLIYMQCFLSHFGHMRLDRQLPFFSDALQVLELTVVGMLQFTKVSQMDDKRMDKFVDLCLQFIMICMAVLDPKDLNQLQNLVKCCLRFTPSLSGGRSVLHLAVNRYWHKNFYLRQVQDLPYAPLVSFLLHCGAEVNAVDDEGNRPLHVIARCRNIDSNIAPLLRIPCMLIQAGAHVDVRNARGQTPLDCAATRVVAQILQKRHLQIRRFLLSQQASAARFPTRRAGAESNGQPFQFTSPLDVRCLGTP